MASLHELKDPIPQDMLDGLREPLESLQGNILRGHGRDSSVHIFLKFKEGKQTEVKQWIKDLAERITSAQQQLDGGGPRPFMTFFLSASGYKYLDPGFPKSQLGFDDKAFLYGMKAAQHRLNDPPQGDLDPGYRKDIHAMILLADNDKDFLRKEESKLCDGLNAHTDICATEYGRVMRIPDSSNPNRRGYSVEHFGYLDSLSHPLFFQSKIEQTGPGTNHWNPSIGPDLVLVRDPYGREYDSGSYLVFRKLEQHVYDFEKCVQELARTLATPLAPTDKDVKRAGALVIGRFKNGTPVVLQSTASQPVPVPNDFNYEDDPHGQKCPLQAHIRKVNPRQIGIPLIVRRGVTYGDRAKEPKHNPSLEELPNKDVGILFMCYQTNIEKQFEVLQYLWANDPRLPDRQEPGIDPVIGQPGGMGAGEQKWPVQWGDPRTKHQTFDFRGFVIFKGGEYFFAPSIHFLKNIQEILRAT
jgi:Dyp-type peroxidase family